jgi:hypothetical protein
MTNNDELFTPKHKILLRISKTLTVFAWITLVFHALLIPSKVLEITTPGNPPFLILLQEYPMFAVNFILGVLNILFNGVLFWLILKGIALGLCMLTETDLNYRSKVGSDL